MSTSASPLASSVSPSSHAQRAVQQLLEQLVGDGREVGIQVAAYRGEECIVDARAGRVSNDPGASGVLATTLFPVFSVAKAVVSLSAHLQAEKGYLDLNAPIAGYWPEFGVHGKERISAMDVLTHRAGLPQMPEGSTVERVRDWNWITSQIAALHPYHDPGKKSFYHAMTYAWLLGEIVRRSDPARRPFERFVRDEILSPLKIDSFFFTVDGALAARVAKLSGAGYANPPEKSAMRLGVPAALDLTPEIFNRALTQHTLIPAVGAYADAHSVARLFAMLANGGALGGTRLLSPERVRSFSELRANSDEPDPYLGHAARLSAGFWLGGDKPAVGSRANIVYSLGAGGSLGWADPDFKLSVGIAHNHMYARQPPDVDPQIAIGRCLRSALQIPD